MRHRQGRRGPYVRGAEAVTLIVASAIACLLYAWIDFLYIASYSGPSGRNHAWVRIRGACGTSTAMGCSNCNSSPSSPSSVALGSDHHEHERRHSPACACMLDLHALTCRGVSACGRTLLVMNQGCAPVRIRRACAQLYYYKRGFVAQLQLVGMCYRRVCYKRVHEKRTPWAPCMARRRYQRPPPNLPELRLELAIATRTIPLIIANSDAQHPPTEGGSRTLRKRRL